MIKSYKDAKAIGGGHLKGALRLAENTNPAQIWCRDTLLCELSEQDILTFAASPFEIALHHRVLSSTLHLVLPIAVLRVGELQYRIDTAPRDLHTLKTSSPEYFQGISFDLASGKCLNRRPDSGAPINVAKRKEFYGFMKDFFTVMQALTRLGVVDAALDKRPPPVSPAWRSEENVDRLAFAIKTGQIDQDLLLDFVRTARGKYWMLRINHVLQAKDVIQTVRNICRANRLLLKQRFGVYDGNDSV